MCLVRLVSKVVRQVSQHDHDATAIGTMEHGVKVESIILEVLPSAAMVFVVTFMLSVLVFALADPLSEPLPRRTRRGSRTPQIISSMRDDAISLLRIEHELHDEHNSTNFSSGMNHSNVLWLQKQLDGICQDNFREEIRRSPGPVLGRILREADGVSHSNCRPTRYKTSIRDPRMATRGLKLQSAWAADEFSGPILVTSSAVSLSSEISRGYKRAVGKQLHDDAERQKFEKQLSDLTLILAQT